MLGNFCLIDSAGQKPGSCGSTGFRTPGTRLATAGLRCFQMTALNPVQLKTPTQDDAGKILSSPGRGGFASPFSSLLTGLLQEDSDPTAVQPVPAHHDAATASSSDSRNNRAERDEVGGHDTIVTDQPVSSATLAVAGDKHRQPRAKEIAPRTVIEKAPPVTSSGAPPRVTDEVRGAVTYMPGSVVSSCLLYTSRCV